LDTVLNVCYKFEYSIPRILQIWVNCSTYATELETVFHICYKFEYSPLFWYANSSGVSSWSKVTWPLRQQKVSEERANCFLQWPCDEAGTERVFNYLLK